MKIIIDAMGGDHAPQEIVVGALRSAEEFGVEVTLVGRGEEILSAMRTGGWDTLPKGVEIANAEDVVDMHADPADVVKQHRGSSMVLGLKMLADGQGDAFISAGRLCASAPHWKRRDFGGRRRKLRLHAGILIAIRLHGCAVF